MATHQKSPKISSESGQEPDLAAKIKPANLNCAGPDKVSKNLGDAGVRGKER